MEKFIYIADDDDNIRNLLKSFLEREGYIVSAFPTGDDLLKKFTIDPCDLIILDVMMPGRDGFFILKEISILNRLCNSCQILVYNSSGTHIQMTNL